MRIGRTLGWAGAMLAALAVVASGAEEWDTEVRSDGAGRGEGSATSTTVCLLGEAGAPAGGRSGASQLTAEGAPSHRGCGGRRTDP